MNKLESNLRDFLKLLLKLREKSICPPPAEK
jgi:hypothetical protein